MPGYIIHLAVGKIYSKNNKIEDIKNFEKGIVEPDMAENKSESHYGPNSSHPDLNRFIKINGISNSYNEGYFLHLVTDYLFYNKFLKSWDSVIYEDYNRLNARIVHKYRITIPKEIQKVVQFKDGELSLLNEEELYKFINSVGKLNVRKIILKKDDLQRQIDKEL